MDILYLLIPLSVLLVALIAGVLIWAIRSGQYDDMDRAANQIFLEDEDSNGAELKGDEDEPR